MSRFWEQFRLILVVPRPHFIDAQGSGMQSMSVCVDTGCRAGGQDQGTALSGGCLCHRTQPSGCLGFFNKYCLSLLPCVLPKFSLSGRHCCLLTPCESGTHLSLSPARLACSPSFSHSLSLLVTLCLFFSSPFVSRTCPCSPSQAHFLLSLPSSSPGFWSPLLSPVRSWHPSL